MKKVLILLTLTTSICTFADNFTLQPGEVRTIDGNQITCVKKVSSEKNICKIVSEFNYHVYINDLEYHYEGVTGTSACNSIQRLLNLGRCQEVPKETLDYCSQISDPIVVYTTN